MLHCLARTPKAKLRGNLAAGGTGEARPLSDTDWAIARAVAPALKEKGLIFVGLDVIGDKLTEINVTSPTCIREIGSRFRYLGNGQVNGCTERRVNAK
ncbi:hypothetical protein OH492_03750 [Vibrio chagasii]|nr:hypothetical protein [Vibrio chagasii]